jgi:hypothetical protein
MDTDFIGRWHIDPSLCDRIIESFEKTDKKGKNPSKSWSFRIDGNFRDIDQELFKEYKKTIWSLLKKYFEMYIWAEDHHSHLSIGNDVNIQHWAPHGSYFSWHCERAGPDAEHLKRQLVFMTYLNDVTDGGETEFFYQKLKIKPEKGLTLIWPSDWPWTHRGIPSHTEDKYIVTGWVHFVNPDKSENL